MKGIKVHKGFLTQRFPSRSLVSFVVVSFYLSRTSTVGSAGNVACGSV